MGTARGVAAVALVVFGGGIAGCEAITTVTDQPSPSITVSGEPGSPAVPVASPSPVRPPQTPPQGAPAPD